MLGTRADQLNFLETIRDTRKEVLDQELKFAIQYMKYLVADDRYYRDRIQFQYDYYYPVQASHVTVHHYHDTSFWETYLWWSILDNHSYHCHGHHHSSDNNDQDSEAAVIISAVLLGLALSAAAYMVLEQFIKAGHMIADGQVAQGSLILGSSLLVGAGTGLIVFLLAAATFTGPIGLLGGALIIAAAMLISATLSKLAYVNAADAYVLTSKETDMLRYKDYSDNEISDIQASINRYNALRPSNYVSIWSDQYKLERELKREITNLKGLAKNSSNFFPMPDQTRVVEATPIATATPVTGKEIPVGVPLRVYPVMPELPRIDGAFTI